MNGDTLALMQAISDARAEMLKAVGDLHQEFSGHKGEIEARMNGVEEKQNKSDNRQWLHSIVVLGLSTIHHELSSWMHLRF